MVPKSLVGVETSTRAPQGGRDAEGELVATTQKPGSPSKDTPLPPPRVRRGRPRNEQQSCQITGCQANLSLLGAYHRVSRWQSTSVKRNTSHRNPSNRHLRHTPPAEIQGVRCAHAVAVRPFPRRGQPLLPTGAWEEGWRCCSPPLTHGHNQQQSTPQPLTVRPLPGAERL